MYTVFGLLIYVILLILLANSKLKTTWIIWIAFSVGYSIAFYKEEITLCLNSVLWIEK